MVKYLINEFLKAIPSINYNLCNSYQFCFKYIY